MQHSERSHKPSDGKEEKAVISEDTLFYSTNLIPQQEPSFKCRHSFDQSKDELFGFCPLLICVKRLKPSTTPDLLNFYGITAIIRCENFPG